ncbi:YqaA family protein [Haloparvum sedimenti]|uniref:YqaA family protein n=1 Tax=Haloparvum sedimenti TaxID=1678448 RepID=UPI0009B5AA22|nr:VTT domain-containing protein [Haloparvum sedimenti]
MGVGTLLPTATLDALSTIAALSGPPATATLDGLLAAGTADSLLSAAALENLWSTVVAVSQSAVESATGWGGLGVIFVYSFLIAFALPGPSEVVLAAPLDLGLPYWAVLGLIMLVSATGKALGSLFAFHLGQEAKRAGPVIRWLERSRFDVVEWSQKRTVTVARRYGYAGLALALCVPFFPDTISIYAFAVLERDYRKFAVATFLGSLGRLVVTILLVGGALAVF